MKIRILQNSIRFRLKQPEVARFNKYGSITETLEFGSDESEQLHFSLKCCDDPEINIVKEKNKIIVFVPSNLCLKWINSEMVGFDKNVTANNGKTIYVLIEKDFACLDASNEENEGSYPNPLDNCATGTIKSSGNIIL
ncbi:MAG: DUF7009 family protein [Flavisolibacter sp.]